MDACCAFQVSGRRGVLRCLKGLCPSSLHSDIAGSVDPVSQRQKRVETKGCPQIDTSKKVEIERKIT